MVSGVGRVACVPSPWVTFGPWVTLRVGDRSLPSRLGAGGITAQCLPHTANPSSVWGGELGIFELFEAFVNLSPPDSHPASLSHAPLSCQGNYVFSSARLIGSAGPTLHGNHR